MESPSSSALTNIRGECGPLWPTSQEDSSSTGWPYKSSWRGSFSSPPHGLELFQPILQCRAKTRTRNWYIYFRHWTSAGSEEHFMPSLCSQSSRKKYLNLELSAHRQTLCLWGSCLTVFPVICINNHCLIVSPRQKYRVCSHWNSWCLFFLFSLLGAAPCIEQKFMNSFLLTRKCCFSHSTHRELYHPHVLLLKPTLFPKKDAFEHK